MSKSSAAVLSFFLFTLAALPSAPTPLAQTAPAAAPQSDAPRDLAPGQTLEREIKGTETHRYTIALRRGEFFQTRAEQKGIDLTLRLSDANGALFATMDSPNGKEGPETLSFVADRAGPFTLEVSTLDAAAEKGAYSLRREPSRPATDRDRRRYDYLRRDAAEGERLEKRASLSDKERDALRRYYDIADRIAANGAEFERLRELQKQGLNAEQQKRFDELVKQTGAANRIFEGFLRQLAREFSRRPNVAGDVRENLSLKGELKDWGEGVVFLYTLVGDERYRVILTTNRAQTDGKYEIKAAALNKKINAFLAAVKDPALDPRPLGKELYDILVKPVEKELDGARAKTLLWALDGSLRLLPLAALWDGQQYLGQRYQNVTVTLASRTRLGGASEPGGQALGLGVTESKLVKDPDGTRQIPFRALPAVAAELAAIVRDEKSPRGLLPGQILLDAEFNEAALKKELSKGYKVIHIASHFSLNPGDATRSFLLLGDGQALTVSEIRASEELLFEGVELLTLSACETAVVEKDGTGKELEGFGYVAQRKGARAILATLWKVADESTQVLMSEFYRLRQEQPRLTKAAAMQLAQQGMLEGRLRPSKVEEVKLIVPAEAGRAGNGPPPFPHDPRKPYAHPYYWSPFILIGNWR